MMATRKKKAPTERKSKAAVAVQEAPSQNGSAHHGTVSATNGGPKMEANNLPTMEEIRLRAYHLYLERGASHGQDLDDWFIAEKLLSESRVKSA
jgi:Protein of unknown function (DUF2934)